jgi:hypothetical protein
MARLSKEAIAAKEAEESDLFGESAPVASAAPVNVAKAAGVSVPKNASLERVKKAVKERQGLTAKVDSLLRYTPTPTPAPGSTASLVYGTHAAFQPVFSDLGAQSTSDSSNIGSQFAGIAIPSPNAQASAAKTDTADILGRGLIPGRGKYAISDNENHDEFLQNIIDGLHARLETATPQLTNTTATKNVKDENGIWSEQEVPEARKRYKATELSSEKVLAHLGAANAALSAHLKAHRSNDPDAAVGFLEKAGHHITDAATELSSFAKRQKSGSDILGAGMNSSAPNEDLSERGGKPLGALVTAVTKSYRNHLRDEGYGDSAMLGTSEPEYQVGTPSSYKSTIDKIAEKKQQEMLADSERTKDLEDAAKNIDLSKQSGTLEEAIGLQKESSDADQVNRKLARVDLPEKISKARKQQNQTRDALRDDRLLAYKSWRKVTNPDGTAPNLNKGWEEFQASPVHENPRDFLDKVRNGVITVKRPPIGSEHPIAAIWRAQPENQGKDWNRSAASANPEAWLAQLRNPRTAGSPKGVVAARAFRDRNVRPSTGAGTESRTNALQLGMSEG